ncbi:hypothetical protein RFI_30319 [Reticulomyxa filosa]|uniref:Kelch motif family protein n=1 Tax=Reticulomyxa filosa TaxID=46433 RepID=X6M258_RETFI|nr:hypothetical protein RFI_30319 [Reticulomyxa filosa]|eukprot:ETO07070.1 hypothetical protein RFI_30319 [Reticulomyxa filosa]
MIYIFLLNVLFKKKITLVMKYVNVWSDLSKKGIKVNHYNRWVPFTDNDNNQIVIGEHKSYYGVRASIGGSKNHLLFINYVNQFSIFDLNKFNFVLNKTFRDEMYFIYSLCFAIVNGLKNEQIHQMIILSFDKMIFIKYNEKYNTIICNYVPVRQSMVEFHGHAYIHLNEHILFFGGYNRNNLRLLHKYSIQENIWSIFEETLPIALSDGVAVLSEDNDIHIIGGMDQEHNELVIHIKTKLRLWDTSQLVIICLLYILIKQKYIYILKYWIRTLQIRFTWVNEINEIIITYGINKTLLSSDIA